jgi:plastocyanin
MRRLAGVAVLSAALLAGTAAIALGAPATITGDGANTFVGGPNFAGDAGTVAQLVVTGSTHNVTSTANGPDGKALFRSATIGSGSTPVNGTQFLAPGSYSFICTVHPTTMSGNLVVGAGTPQARPAVALQVLDKKIAKVIKKAQLRVKLTATGTGSVPVEVFLGKRAIAGKTQLDAPGSTVLKLPLTPKGLKALAKKKKATVTVKSSIPFGSPVTVTGALK